MSRWMLCVHAANAVIHGIGNIQMPILVDGNCRRKIQERFQRRPAVACKSFGHADPVYDIAHRPAQVRLLGEGLVCRHGPIAEGVVDREGGLLCTPSLGGRQCEPSSDRLDGAAHPINLAYDMVFGIGNKQIPVAVEAQVFRFIQRGGEGKAAVPGESRCPVAGHASHCAKASIDVHGIIQDFSRWHHPSRWFQQRACLDSGCPWSGSRDPAS